MVHDSRFRALIAIVALLTFGVMACGPSDAQVRAIAADEAASAVAEAERRMRAEVYGVQESTMASVRFAIDERLLLMRVLVDDEVDRVRESMTADIRAIAAEEAAFAAAESERRMRAEVDRVRESMTADVRAIAAEEAAFAAAESERRMRAEVDRVRESTMASVQRDLDRQRAVVDEKLVESVDALCEVEYGSASLWYAVWDLIQHLDGGDPTLADVRAFLIDGLEIDDYHLASNICYVDAQGDWQLSR